MKGKGQRKEPTMLTEQALLDAYKPHAAAYVMEISECSTPEQIEDMVMSDPEKWLPLVTEYGQFSGKGGKLRDYFELPRIRRFLTALYLVAHHGRKGDWRSHAAKKLLQKLVPKRKGGSPTDFHDSIRGTFGYALRDAKLVLTPVNQRFVMRVLAKLKTLDVGLDFEKRCEWTYCLLQREIGFDCCVGVTDVRYLHDQAVRHAKLDPRGYAIDATARTYGISPRHVRGVVADIR